MTDINTLRNLLFQIKNGDRKSFEKFFRMYYEKFIKVSLLYVRGYTNAEDIVSDVFVKFLRQLDRVEKVEKIEAYLFMMVRNQCLDFLKRKDNKSLFLVEEYEEHHLINAGDLRIEIEGNELREIIEKCVEQFPPKRKIVYRLIKEDSLTYKEVAEILSVSPKTVDNHLAVAIKTLRTAISAYYQERSENTVLRSIKS
jgi:RNA polymerase sigma-70 factor (family 1)